MSSKARKNSVRMTEHEVDDVAFLTGESGNVSKRNMYERDRIAVCSQKRAMAVALFVFIILFMIAVLIAFATPLNGCSFFPGTSGVFNDTEDETSGKFIATNGEDFPHKDARLPNHTLPRHYTISIHPNLTTLEVVGWVVIQFVVTEETHVIVLHSKKLRIIEKWLKEEIDGKPQEPHNISKFLEYEENQQIYLEVESPLYPEKNYSLGIRFQTNISRELEGFYLSSYVDSKGEKRLLATTHFEPTYARSAFPCFDEPQYKATFKMIIIRDRQHKSLFNMPIKKIETVYYGYNIELWRDEFYESVEMSTYLVAFVVCDYNSTEATTRKNVKVSIHTPENLVNQSVFALETAVQLMDYYDDFFGVPYPLPKQDLIAIPDFGAGAMENWGLITYRETSILYDSTESSSTAHQWVAVVVAHELAHQWFGNLVTMKWWKDLWLNEGFASFVEYVGVDHIKPDWKMMEQFVLEKTQPALALDALDNSHPISVEVADPREIEAIFDTISYSKGAAILYMLKTVLGQDVLRQGLMHYLNENKFKNAETDDFWTSLSQSTNGTLQVKSIMDTWTQQMGFPLITVRIDNHTVRASQRRFLMSPPDLNHTSPIDANPGFDYRPTSVSDNEYQWYIPLSYTSDVKQSMEFVWMNKTEHEFSLPYRPNWIKFNVNQTGFYRVHYEPKLWAALMRVLKSNPSAFTPTDRANLIDDAFTLCKAGLVGAEVPLELTQYLVKETEYVPWATALEHFRAWSKVLFDSPAHRMLLKYVDKLIGPVVKFVGWNDNGSHLVKLLRSDILYAAVYVDNESAVKEANQRFNNWRTKGSAVPPNLREVVYSAGVKYGGATAWDHCWARYNRTQVPSERKLLLKALGAARNPWLLQQYLAACLDRDKIRPQDVRTVLPVVAANPAGRLLAWRHLRAHWSHYQTIFGQGSFTMGGLITSVVAHFSNEFDYDEVNTYFTDVDVGSGARALNQSLETIRLNIRWLESNEQALVNWLEQNL